MKFFKFTILAVFMGVSALASAQVPQGISYQTAIRNNTGALVTNQAVGIRLSVLQGSASGTVAYQETHSATTTNLGLINIILGSGSPVVGTFPTINWSTGPYFVRTEVDVNGGSSYALMGTNQLLSVPYALYAESAAGFPDGDSNGDTPYWDGTQWVYTNSNLYNDGTNVGIGVSGAPTEKLQVNGHVDVMGNRIKNVAAPVDSDDAVNAEVIQYSQLTYGLGAGTSNAYTVTLAPTVTAYAAGMMLTFKANAANTAAATLNVNGLGAVTIKKYVSTDLAANDIVSGQMVTVIYDGATFQMLSPATGLSTVTSGGGGSGGSSDSNTLIYTTKGF